MCQNNGLEGIIFHPIIRGLPETPSMSASNGSSFIPGRFGSRARSRSGRDRRRNLEAVYRDLIRPTVFTKRSLKNSTFHSFVNKKVSPVPLSIMFGPGNSGPNVKAVSIQG